MNRNTLVPIQLVDAIPFEQISLEDRKKLIQQQLIILLHANKCAIRNTKNKKATEQTRCQECTLPHCSMMKVLIGHLQTCNNVDCDVAHCSSSRKIIEHWLVCSPNAHCPVCSQIRDAQNGRLPRDMCNDGLDDRRPPP
ncbi:unnamed protein product [Caenorhabditis sp. 36 PRJEB53466]|nr:unnamed protein product [Caenorhabditis sp. 36 PRJEB53466]